MKRFLFILLLAGVFSNGFSQKKYFGIDKGFVPGFETDSIIPYLALYYYLCDKGVGYNSIPCLNFEKFEFYAANYPIDTILKLTGEGYALGLRIYSFWALLRRGYDSLEYIGERLLADTTGFRFYSGCLLEYYRVKEFIYELMAGHIDFDYKRFSKERLLAIRKKYSIRPVYKDDWSK